ncbi:TonB-dependent receptor [Chitinophaga horti]|uniref:TonB-dependent receptor n=1 Tax=Chitinophaga horti TaxID=2920382 RepID=A0ABY6J9M1_9BACT|nr:TonB-dependent receptor [Chitinophaga horti]UYQ94869.1 TonB-dependent receptor [Chitinophaga horti]
MKKVLVLLLTLLFPFLAAWPQTRQIRGKVTDDKKEALIGVTVSVANTSIGTVTDANGQFVLNVPGSGEVELNFSILGFKKKKLRTDGKSAVNLVLEPDMSSLNDVVVIGYQTVKRKDLTGAVSSLGPDALKDMPLSSAAEAITGRLAGVQVQTTEGRPGADITIRVRGGGSITQDNSPLYIVDGIQLDNALSVLSPQEIESIDVLKDAASTAIYGARGANGVMVITTKGGREMKTRLSYDGYAGARQIVNKLDVMKPYDFVKYQHQLYNRSADDRAAFEKNYGRWEDLDIYKNMPFTDWQDEVFGRNAFTQTHVLSVMGGSKTTSFNLNLNNTQEEGIMIESGFKRTLLSFKFDHKVNDKLKFGLNTRYSSQRIDGVGTSNTGSQGTNRLRNSVRFKPFVAPGDESSVDEFDSEYALLTNLTSPVLLAKNELRYQYRKDVILNGWFNFEIIKNLNFRSVIGTTITNSRDNVFNGSITSTARQNANMPVASMGTRELRSLTNSNTLSYRLTLPKKHQADVLIGQEIYQTDVTNSNMTVKWLPVDITADEAFAGIQKATPPAGMIQDAPTSSKGLTRQLSFFGNAKYSYDDKYLFNASLRYDGSSKFLYDNGFAAFPSAGVAWRITKESFFTPQRWLSDLKLRFTYGASGNNRIGDNLFKTMYNTSTSSYAFGEAITPGIAPLSLANPRLKWETTIARNLGLDFTLFAGRLSGAVDFYHNNTRDLLLDARVASTTGYTTQLQNIGKTENRGVEVQLNAVILNKKDFSWGANFNIGANRNKIVTLGTNPNGEPIKSYLVRSGWENNLYDFLVEVGSPIGQFYGYVTDGFYTTDDFDFNASNNTYTLKAGIPNTSAAALGAREPQPGDLKFKKFSDKADMKVGEEDRRVLGNAQPKFTGGLNQQFMYKGIDLSIFVNWSYGNKVYNANKVEYTTAYLYKDNNMLSLMNDRYKLFDENGQRVYDPGQLKAMNVNTKYWTPSLGNYTLHSFAIEDGSFLRISNVTLGYSLPEAMLKKTKVFTRVRVYATVNNLHTFTKYSGFDPEASTRRSNPLTPAVDYAAYPRSRFILGGVNVSF